MIEAIPSESITSFVKRVRKTEPLRKPAIVIPVTTKPKRVYQKPDQPDFPLDEWTMPPQAEGYIKCARHDFL
jgi:hypothetical protein